jgi:murein DD-endopeptidase MepM/ murein hydrolase activator NlpD
LLVQNLQAAEVTVTFEMDLVNLSSSVPFPFTTTLTGMQRIELFRLTPKDAGLGWSWTYTYYSTFGSTAAKHDDRWIYSLPYSPGQAYRVSQAYNGEYSHFGADQFAIDWRMPIGTPVHAARGGVVAGVKDDSSVGGDDSKFDWDANYVLIQHSDGTLGQYVHLEKGGCRVKVGERVEVGDLLGLSGNTGHSTGPHLHFSVFKAKDGKHRQTIPIRYRTMESVAVVLEEGHSYRAIYQSNLASAAGEKTGPVLPSEGAVGTSALSQLDSAAVRVTEGLGH